MVAFTPNLSLAKPAYSDFVDVNVLNGNMDILDGMRFTETTRPYCSRYMGAGSTSVSPDSRVAITWASTQLEQPVGWVSSNNFIIPFTGYYHFFLYVAWLTEASVAAYKGNWVLWLRKNGPTVWAANASWQFKFPDAVGSPTDVHGSHLDHYRQCTVGESYTFYVQRDNGPSDPGPSGFSGNAVQDDYFRTKCVIEWAHA